MFKVVCINDNWEIWNHKHISLKNRLLLLLKHPKKGKTYTVTYVGKKGHYSLEGWDINIGFRPDFFTKLQDVFATEVLERIKEEINQENLQEV